MTDRVVQTISEIDRNTQYFDLAITDKGDVGNFAKNLLKNGKHFVALRIETILVFCPSKFVGYQDNSIYTHAKLRTLRDGKITNKALDKLIRTTSIDGDDDYKEVFQAFLDYNKRNGAIHSKFHKQPKFWLLDGASSVSDVGDSNRSHDFSGDDVTRTVKQRVGQVVFREALLKEFVGTCPIAGISEAQLVRASHIIAWADKEGEPNRLNPKNGILLSGLWDAAFDKGLISFKDNGSVLWSPAVSKVTRRIMKASITGKLPADSERATFLAHHRKLFGFN